MKNKEEIILDMCFTYRHDYWLEKSPEHPCHPVITPEEREFIHRRMTQIYDNCIEPYVVLK